MAAAVAALNSACRRGPTACSATLSLDMSPEASGHGRRCPSRRRRRRCKTADASTGKPGADHSGGRMRGSASPTPPRPTPRTPGQPNPNSQPAQPPPAMRRVQQAQTPENDPGGTRTGLRQRTRRKCRRPSYWPSSSRRSLLYPDPLLSQVLMASTYPLEVVEAARWVDQAPAEQGSEGRGAAQRRENRRTGIRASPRARAVPRACSHDAERRKFPWTQNLGNVPSSPSKSDVMAAVQSNCATRRWTGRQSEADRRNAAARSRPAATPSRSCRSSRRSRPCACRCDGPTVAYGEWLEPSYPPSPSPSRPVSPLRRAWRSAGIRSIYLSCLRSFLVELGAGFNWGGGYHSPRSIPGRFSLIGGSRSALAGGVWVHDPAHRPGGVAYAAMPAVSVPIQRRPHGGDERLGDARTTAPAAPLSGSAPPGRDAARGAATSTHRLDPAPTARAPRSTPAPIRQPASATHAGGDVPAVPRRAPAVPWRPAAFMWRRVRPHAFQWRLCACVSRRRISPAPRHLRMSAVPKLPMAAAGMAVAVTVAASGRRWGRWTPSPIIRAGARPGGDAFRTDHFRLRRGAHR